jgi:hypothetical protein
MAEVNADNAGGELLPGAYVPVHLKFPSRIRFPRSRSCSAAKDCASDSFPTATPNWFLSLSAATTARRLKSFRAGTRLDNCKPGRLPKKQATAVGQASGPQNQEHWFADLFVEMFDEVPRFLPCPWCLR